MTEQELDLAAAQERDLRRQRAECRADAIELLPRLTRLALEHENLLTRTELKTIDAVTEALRAIFERLGRS